MKKLADISAFEGLQGKACSGAISDVSVFNGFWLYQRDVAIPSYLLGYILYGEHDGLHDEEQVEAEEKSFDDWIHSILAETGGNGFTLDGWDEEENEDFCYPAFGEDLRGDCVRCDLWIDTPYDERPDWALDDEEDIDSEDDE